MTRKTYCGYVALIGCPNVGKSTLLNRILGEKISITSRKPQTTRHRILGIDTKNNIQAIYVDTPGLHQGINKALNRQMNKAAWQSIRNVDVIVFIVSGFSWTEDDKWILKRLKTMKCPIILAINKVDVIKDKERLLPHIERLSKEINFAKVFPISALKGMQVDKLRQSIAAMLPESVFFFPEDQLSDRSDRFLCAEIIREKLIRQLGDELPYASTVVIEQFKEEEKIFRIAAVIYVEKEGQKAIVLGKGGERLKEIGRQARIAMETLLSKKIFLQLWVKVKKHWSDDKRILQSLGYEK